MHAYKVMSACIYYVCMNKYIHSDTKKRELLKNSTKIEEILEKKIY